MFQTLTACPVRAGLSADPVRFQVGAGHILLALAAAATIALGVMRGDGAPAGVADVSAGPAATLVAQPGQSLQALDASAEALKASLLAIPGVGAVQLRGVQTAGVDILYSPALLARQGVREADLLSALPGRSALRAPGRIGVSPAAAEGGPQAIVNLPVRAGGHVFRLGDLAAVARTRLAVPLSTVQRDGRPAIDVVVTPARGAAGGALDRKVAATLGSEPSF